MEIPTHPEADEPPAAPARASGSSRPAAGRRSTVVAIALLGLLAVVVILHVAGVMGPGG